MASLPTIETGKKTLYHDVAGRITHLIDQGTFATGDRVPSVRKLSEQLHVSITTVMEAYRVLEDRGLLEARPQSGYYVRQRFAEPPPEPGTSRPSAEPTAVNISDLSMRILRSTSQADLIQFGAAIPNPELLPLEKLNRTLGQVARQNPVLSSSYVMPPGCESLRVQIARRALISGCTLTPDQIVTTVGGQEAISLSLRAICKPGDTVAIESPMFYGILQAIEFLGLRALEIPTHPRDGISIEALRYAMEHNTIKACLVVSNFSNPLGSCMPESHKRELVELLAEQEIPLIEDDIYGDLYFGSERPKVAKAFDRRGLVVLCSSFSKTLAPGYRVGWVAAGRFQTQIEHQKLVSNLATPTAPQLAVAEFLANGGYDHHLRRVRRVYADKVAGMAQAIGRYFPDGTRVTRPAGGFVLWVECPPYVDALVLYEQALRAGMTIAPGPIFSAKQKYGNFIRLNAAFWSAEVEPALAELGRLAGAMKTPVP
jgi:DNA-binding transcriptional MocR family regulator